MIHTSPFPVLDIPDTALTNYVMRGIGGRLSRRAPTRDRDRKSGDAIPRGDFVLRDPDDRTNVRRCMPRMAVAEATRSRRESGRA